MNERLKKKLDLELSKNIQADEFFVLFIKKGSDAERSCVFKYLIELSKTSNKNLKIRSKSLAFIHYFHFICCNNSEEWYQDGNVFCPIIKKEIDDILEENINEINGHIYSYSKLENNEIASHIKNVIHCISEFNIKTRKSDDFIKLVFDHFNLEEKVKKQLATNTEDFIYDQISRILNLKTHTD